MTTNFYVLSWVIIFYTYYIYYLNVATWPLAWPTSLQNFRLYRK